MPNADSKVSSNETWLSTSLEFLHILVIAHCIFWPTVVLFVAYIFLPKTCPF